jgi:GNAT superfamily N-acetyltransferase
VGWAQARGQLAEEVLLFEEGREPAAWLGLGMDEPDYHLIHVPADQARSSDAVVSTLVDHSATRSARVEVGVDDTPVTMALRRAGLVDDATVLGMRRPATEDAPAPPAGYAIRAVRPDELDQRVSVHRSAWLPAALPYAALHRPPTEPDATSSFDREAYDSIRQTWLYNPELDLVVTAPDGTFAACCIGWLDPDLGVAEIEPMGVVPEHRGKGLAVALCHELAARVHRLGGRELFINTGPREEYPAPGRAYAKAGFEPFARARLMVKPQA